MALGLAAAGFEHSLVADWDKHACATLVDNAKRVPEMADWEIVEADVRTLDFAPHKGRVTLLAAGAPCQPFSLGGKHRGDEDTRNMFPEVFRAVRELRPEAVLVENVKGLLRESFRPYFEYILLSLAMPENQPAPDEDWREHRARLEKLASDEPVPGELRYNVTKELVDVANFGVPQNRHRVLIVALRSDVGTPPALSRTHSEDALLYAQYVDGSYWREHELPQPEVPARVARRVERLRQLGRPTEWRWRTVRDALRGLPEPHDYQEDQVFPNHSGIPGAKSYKGHTGSPLDWPAKTLKAGVHGVPGGENMLRRPDGSVRYFTVRETARLQTFPDAYRYSGPWGECMRQLGNAVPVKIGEQIGKLIKTRLEEAHDRRLTDEIAVDQQEVWPSASGASS